MSELKAVKHYLVIDLEATTDDGPDEERAVPRDEMETIEIGAVLVRASTLEVEDEFQTFERPVRHPTLTSFCTELTGIKQEMVADAPTFPEAMEALRQAMLVGRWGVVWNSWGLFDDTQLRRDCTFHGIEYTMPEHMNLKNVFSAAQGRRKRYGMSKALRLCGLPLEGAHHRALDDAKNIARLLPWIVGGKRLPAHHRQQRGSKRNRPREPAKGDVDPEVDEAVERLLPAFEALHRLHQEAEAAGIFTGMRDLLSCPRCGLAEDVTAQSRLITYRGDPPGEDTGLWFDERADGRFRCPACGETIVIEQEGE